MDDDNEISIDHDLYDDNQEMYIRNLKNLIRKQTDLIKTLRAEITSLSVCIFLNFSCIIIFY